jgi:hypothetical protein
VGETRRIKVDGREVGLTGLDQALEELAPGLAGQGDAAAGQALLTRLARENYIPDAARPAYVRALARQLRKFLGQDYAEEPSPGLTVRILGQGCARCEALTSAVLGVLGEMGLAADVEHLRDIKEIAAYGVMGTPALVINGKVVAVGQTPNPGQLRQWLAQAAG